MRVSLGLKSVSVFSYHHFGEEEHQKLATSMDKKAFTSLMNGPCEQRKLGGKYQLPQRSGVEEGSGKGGGEG